VGPDRTDEKTACTRSKRRIAIDGRPPASSSSSGSKEGTQLFETQRTWDRWLAANHKKASGIWLRLAKKGSRTASVTYPQALESALCYGWIGGQKKADSAAFWLQRFVPRKKGSIWSRINREKVTVLVKNGQMKPAGLAAVEAAKSNGRWEAAYDAPGVAAVPPDFQIALDANPKAKAFFAILERRNSYAVLFRIQTARKAETRARRIKQFVEMLERHQKFHP
jgi:uncharacterized protein YdeI (YjbR/CyaY-like superfamily)